MTIANETTPPLNWGKSLFYAALAVVCFHLAYTPINHPIFGLFIFGYAFGLVRLTDQPTVRRAFYVGLVTGFLCGAPQLAFFWNIFGRGAIVLRLGLAFWLGLFTVIVLWLVFAFWIGLFTATVCGCIRRWGKVRAVWLIPIIWTGLEYFRSELYYLKFSWLNIGYLSTTSSEIFGMYGTAFLLMLLVILGGTSGKCFLKMSRVREVLAVMVIVAILAAMLLPAYSGPPRRSINIVGVQMEFPPANIVPKLLNQALAKNTNAQIFVLSEYTLDGAVPDSLKNWCHDNSKFLVVGGKDFVTNHIYYNTAFVVGTNGEIVFQQAKSVPIQFFHDGLPASKQEVWNSPWGKIGICICYDLSYTRVTDRLVEQGAQLLIVPTMDVAEWGRHEHELHSRVAPVRAAEYGIPIFRLASSGISQAVTGGGVVVAQTRIPGSGDILSAKLQLPSRGTLPLDRFLAPVCVLITGVVLFWLILLSLREDWKRKGKT